MGIVDSKARIFTKFNGEACILNLEITDALVIEPAYDRFARYYTPKNQFGQNVTPDGLVLTSISKEDRIDILKIRLTDAKYIINKRTEKMIAYLDDEKVEGIIRQALQLIMEQIIDFVTNKVEQNDKSGVLEFNELDIVELIQNATDIYVKDRQ